MNGGDRAQLHVIKPCVDASLAVAKRLGLGILLLRQP